jgi:RNA polymerase sigma-70 factor (ECF subfamily)
MQRALDESEIPLEHDDGRLKNLMPGSVEEGVRRKTEPEDASIARLAIVYERGYRRFLRVAEGLVHDAELARDVVQDGFARAIQARFDYRSDGSLEGWVWRIVVNTARNAARDRTATTLPLHDLADEPHTNGAPRNAELSTVLAALPERQRLVLFLRYYADLDYRRIAEVLEIQPGTVAATLNHAHEAVRRSLEATRR